MVIESTRNPKVKAWRALRDRKQRDRTGTFLIEGERESIRAAGHLEITATILRSDRQDVALPSPVMVSEAVFAALSARQNPDGVAVVARTPDLSLHRLVLPPSGVCLIGDAIEKPGNVGAMIRSADGFGAAFVGASLASDIVNPNAVRAAQGSLFSTPVASARREEVIEWATANTRPIIADPTGSVPLWDADLTGSPVSLVIGSEHAGVDEAWHDVGEAVSIPLLGSADSLNASVTAAVFLAEAIRQRR